MNKKGALELSMNTIIIIVIGVVLLSGPAVVVLLSLNKGNL